MHRGQTFVAFSHADVIRAAVLHYAGVSLDDFDRFEISPASVTALLMNPGFVRFPYINLPDRSDGMSCAALPWLAAPSRSRC